ncbi:2-aminoethylphosphonate ABC transporter substrate-binding protein [Phaeobacter inhibens]|uniref:ABC transporter substrate-binding protein n=1 Tax=Phaeobacter inhibens TaxID=221822 RepID=UPI000C99F51C|nr:ABC transporter substrate-binding protein [Phaeobacter inhibens]AUR04122.1 2-aminoethylphosphonate ABC transporter substrate-binding protein [Phaeobacter inhibens]
MKHALIGAIAGALFASTALATEIETKSLEELYAEAVAEGGELVIRAGGDKDDQADYYLDMFKERFPEINVTHSVDLSFYHASRYDNARNDADKSDVPDVIQLQTLHDYDYYAERGLLERYKPKNWEKVYPDYKDPHGNWVGLFGVAFTNVFNSDLINEDDAPRDALDYLDPALKGKVILTYPHTDDAVLYQFWNLKEQYGWEYLEQLVATEPTWVRGTSMPYVAIDNGWYGASFTTSWAFVPFEGSDTRLVLPEEDYFLTWFQTAAIPTDAKHKAAAKLYLNWMLSEEFQGKWLQFPVRMDVKSPDGYKSHLHYNTSPADFHRFMLKRDQVERFRLQIEQLVGPAEGPAPLELDYSVKP